MGASAGTLLSALLSPSAFESALLSRSKGGEHGGELACTDIAPKVSLVVGPEPLPLPLPDSSSQSAMVSSRPIPTPSPGVLYACSSLPSVPMFAPSPPSSRSSISVSCTRSWPGPSLLMFSFVPPTPSFSASFVSPPPTSSSSPSCPLDVVSSVSVSPDELASSSPLSSSMGLFNKASTAISSNSSALEFPLFLFSELASSLAVFLDDVTRL